MVMKDSFLTSQTNPAASLAKFSTPPAIAGSTEKKPQPVFAGFTKPSTDMEAVRDGRRAPLLYLDIPLDSTFTIASGNPLVLPLSGNSFYIDQDTSIVGNGYVHFQDTNLQSASAPIYVGAGFIAKVPFTQILIENKIAQAGKVLRIVYGTDVDFTAGLNATIAISDQPPVRFTGTSQQHTATTSSGQLVPANASRKFIMVQNKDTTMDIYLAFGVAATTANGFLLKAGASMTLDAAVCTNAINTICPAGTNANIVHLWG
jgi:hypothetical protein